MGDFQLLSSKLFIFQLVVGLCLENSLHTQSDGFELILLKTPMNAAGPPTSWPSKAIVSTPKLTFGVNE